MDLSGLLPDASKALLPGVNDQNPIAKGSQIQPTIIIETGDLLVEYADVSSSDYCWKVTSKDLVHHSRYFQVLLDPDKFAEGAKLKAQREALNEDDSRFLNSSENKLDLSLPRIRIPVNPVTTLCGAESIETFLKVLCQGSMTTDTRSQFLNALRVESPSLVARVIQIADSFNSLNVVSSILWEIEYSFGKRDKLPLRRLDPVFFRMKEQRIRQNIVIAKAMNEYSIGQSMTHTLLITGSKLWLNRPEPPSKDHLQWQYLPDGIEGMLEDGIITCVLHFSNTAMKRNCTTGDSVF